MIDENNKIVMTEWALEDKKMTRKPVLAAHVLPGSYAEIDGKRI
jgi:hypothetical protein